MQVESLEKLGKGRYRMLLEDGSELILYRGDLRRYDIREAEEISEESLREIREELLYQRAVNRLLYLLQRKDYTRTELAEKLWQGRYPAEAAERAIQAMEAYGYVDDVSYTERYVECYRGRRSSGELRSALLRKGIARELVEQALERCPAEEGAEQEQIRRLLRKRHYDAASAEPGERRRQYAYLMGKGYRSSDIIACLDG